MSNPNEQLINRIVAVLSDETAVMSASLLGFLIVFIAAYFGINSRFIDSNFILKATNDILGNEQKQGLPQILLALLFFVFKNTKSTKKKHENIGCVSRTYLPLVKSSQKGGYSMSESNISDITHRINWKNQWIIKIANYLKEFAVNNNSATYTDIPKHKPPETYLVNSRHLVYRPHHNSRAARLFVFCIFFCLCVNCFFFFVREFIACTNEFTFDLRFCEITKSKQYRLHPCCLLFFVFIFEIHIFNNPLSIKPKHPIKYRHQYTSKLHNQTPRICNV